MNWIRIGALALVILCGVAVLLGGCAKKPPETAQLDAPEVSGAFRVQAFCIGKADAFLLQTAQHAVLIDTGHNRDGEAIARALTEQGISTLDYLIITHFDKDHVGGADTVLEKIGAARVLEAPYDSDTKQVRQYREALEGAGVQAEALCETLTFTLDDVLFEVMPPKRTEYAGDNDYSIAVRATHGENVFFFAGDAEEARSKELLAAQLGACDFYKVPHHGRFNATTVELIGALAPKVALITCSEEEGADQKTLNALDAEGAQTYLTRDYQSIVIHSDGETLDVVTK